MLLCINKHNSTYSERDHNKKTNKPLIWFLGAVCACFTIARKKKKFLAVFWLYCTLVTTSTTDSKIHNTHTRHALPFSIISTLILLRMFATRNRFPRTVDTNEEEVWWNCRITCCSMRARAHPYRPIWRTCHVRISFSNCDVIILAFFVQVKKRLNPNLNGIFGQLARNYGLDAFEQFVFFLHGYN